MRFNMILSSELPDIDSAIKECVNSGQWFLFKCEGSGVGRERVFFLKIGRDWFELDDRGRVKNYVQDGECDFASGELVYFSDLPQPESLSNAALANYL